MYDGTFYSMIEVKVTIDPGRFENRAYPHTLIVNDGSNEVSSFLNELSGNEKELLSYFAVDAFTGFGSSSDLILTYANEPPEFSISGVNVTSIPALPLNLSLISHNVADNAWLATL